MKPIAAMWDSSMPSSQSQCIYNRLCCHTKSSARMTLGSRQDCQMLGARERDFRLIPMTARQTVFYKRCSLTNCRLWHRLPVKIICSSASLCSAASDCYCLPMRMVSPRGNNIMHVWYKHIGLRRRTDAGLQRHCWDLYLLQPNIYVPILFHTSRSAFEQQSSFWWCFITTSIDYAFSHSAAFRHVVIWSFIS